MEVETIEELEVEIITKQMVINEHVHQVFYDKLKTLPREKLIQIIEKQDKETFKEITRIEYVFRNKLSHINNDNGEPITERDLTREELIRLIDPPFIFSKELSKAGFNEEAQRQIHTASDPVLWCKDFLSVRPRAYQTLMLRSPNHKKVMRLGRRLGKALALDTVMPSPDGWTTMGELEVGSRVFDENGLPCNVTFVTDVMDNHSCYRVEFSDGSSIDADAEHLWSVETKSIRKNNARNKHIQHDPIILTTEQMLGNLNIGTKGESNYSIKTAGPLQYVKDDIDLPLDPYVLGFWLGDGTLGTGYVSIGKQDAKESIANIKSLGYEIHASDIKHTDINYLVSSLRGGLKELGVLKEKKIPEVYKTASVDQRLELLRGLMDTDGSCSENGWCEYTSSDPELAEGVYDLIVQLGFKATKKISPAYLYGVRHKDRHRIAFRTSTPVFKLGRKIQRQLSVNFRSEDRRFIVDIVPIDSVPVKCITVDSSKHLYLAGRECIVTHNTFSMAMLMLWYAYTNNNARVLVVAPMKSHVALIYEAIQEFLKNSPIVKESVIRAVTAPQFEMKFSNGSTIRYFTSGMRSGGRSDVARGQEADLIILDELDYMGSDDLIALYAMMQSTTGEKHTKKMLVGASTPTGLRGKFWEWCTDKKYGFDAYWFPSLANPHWTMETETEMRLEYTPQGYRHEIEADWGEVEEGVYPRWAVDRAFTDNDWPYSLSSEAYEAESKYVMGVDWDKYGAGVNIIILEICGNGYADDRLSNKIRVVYREEVIKGEFTYTAGVERILYLDSIFHCDHIYVDRGAGEMQIEILMKRGMDDPSARNIHKRLKGWQFSETIEISDPFTGKPQRKEIKAFMVDNLYRMIEEENIKFSSQDDELYFQLISYVVLRNSAYGKPIFGPGGSAVDHAHDALILAALAVAQNYDDLLKVRFARKSKAISSDAMMGLFALDTQQDKEIAEDKWGSDKSAAPIMTTRAMSANIRPSRHRRADAIKRKMF